MSVLHCILRALAVGDSDAYGIIQIKRDKGVS